MKGGQRGDAKNSYTTSKVIMLFVCGCYESELCLRVIHSADFLEKKHFLKGSKRNETEMTIPKFVQ